MNDPDYRLMISRIGLLLQNTLPDPSEINIEDAVALLVRENNALRMALGIPTYDELTQKENR